MAIKKFTPTLIVGSIEKTIPFWEEQLGYKVAMTAPHHETIGFAILKQGESEVVLQSKASLAKDLPAIANKLSTQTVVLYADVD